ncbi:MAG TPA: hypothetical protein VFM54_16665 [Micromonosporaceae bacterium]|nr:hypothetical protein [Micromonosporaceae bacterium]
MTTWSQLATVTVEVSSAAPTAAPVWVDITGYVRTAQPIDISRGRDSVLAESMPKGRLRLTLDNADSRFTSGYTGSPYYPWWAQGKRIRIRETIGSDTFELFSGYLEVPQVRERVEGVDNLVTVSAVDWLGRAEQDRTMISTLGEHIRYHGGSALRAYWTLGEAQGSTVDTSAGGTWPLYERSRLHVGGGTYVPDDPITPSITYGVSGGPPGDELTMIDFQPSRSTSPLAYFQSVHLAGDRSASLDLVAGTVMTMVAWVRIDTPLPTSQPRLVQVQSSTNGFGAIELASTGALAASAARTGWSGAVTGGAAPVDTLIPVAVRFGFDPAVIELWAGEDVYSGTMTVTTPTTADMSQMYIGWPFDGRVSHVQLYLGAAGDWTHNDYLAQLEMARHGLEGQTAAERIATLLGYAGVSSSAKSLTPAVMRQSRLAGRTVVEAIGDAVTTEQGLCFVDGAGRLVLHNRIRRYNV